MGWVLVIGAAWVALAAVAAVLIAATVRFADRGGEDSAATPAGPDHPNVVPDVPPAHAAEPTYEGRANGVPTSPRPVAVEVPAPPAPDDAPTLG